MWHIPTSARRRLWLEPEFGRLRGKSWVWRDWKNQILRVLEPSKDLGIVGRFLTSCPTGLKQTVLVHRKEQKKSNGEAYGRERVAWALGSCSLLSHSLFI